MSNTQVNPDSETTPKDLLEWLDLLLNEYSPSQLLNSLGDRIRQQAQDLRNDEETTSAGINVSIILRITSECLENDVLSDMETFIDRLERSYEMV